MLNQDQRNILAATISESASFYGKSDISKHDISGFINIIEKFFIFPFDQILSAFNNYILDPKNKYFPSPATLRPYINPELDGDTMATLAASRAIEAVTRFGWNNSTDARAYIGELGWTAIKRFGGWVYVCENMGKSLSVNVFLAQVRDLSKSIIKQDKLGIVDGPIQISAAFEKTEDMVLSDKKNEQSLKLISYLKLLPKEIKKV